MRIVPVGDYYVWYCEWCDSRNRTMWARMEEERVVCGVCHKAFKYSAIPDAALQSP